jgi:hypothetical protein
MQKLPFELLKASMANQAMTNISTGKLVTKSRGPALWVDNIFLCRARSKVMFESPLATASRGKYICIMFWNYQVRINTANFEYI